MNYREKPSTYDRLLAENPPRIVWRKNNRGIRVAVSVDDPHVDSSPRATTKAEREAAAEHAERQRLQVLQLLKDEAEEVAERFRKHRTDNSPLMAAARTEI